MWHKTVGKIFLITVGILFIATTVIFTIFFVYYLWQVKYGGIENIEKLSEKFSPQFTAHTNLENTIPKIVENQSAYIHPHNPAKGEENAPITILAFIDFQCQYCQQAYTFLEDITTRYNPVVKVVFKYLPLIDNGDDIFAAPLAAACAHEQNRFWEYHNIIFQSKQFNIESLRTVAIQIGLDINTFDKCVSSKKYQQNIKQDMLDAVDIGIRGTPTYIVNGEIVEGIIGLDIWNNLILEHLK